jgi:hypothetical protein
MNIYLLNKYKLERNKNKNNNKVYYFLNKSESNQLPFRIYSLTKYTQIQNRNQKQKLGLFVFVVWVFKANISKGPRLF